MTTPNWKGTAIPVAVSIAQHVMVADKVADKVANLFGNRSLPNTTKPGISAKNRPFTFIRSFGNRLPNSCRTGCQIKRSVPFLQFPDRFHFAGDPRGFFCYIPVFGIDLLSQAINNRHMAMRDTKTRKAETMTLARKGTRMPNERPYGDPFSDAALARHTPVVRQKLEAYALESRSGKDVQYLTPSQLAEILLHADVMGARPYKGAGEISQADYRLVLTGTVQLLLTEVRKLTATVMPSASINDRLAAHRDFLNNHREDIERDLQAIQDEVVRVLDLYHKPLHLDRWCIVPTVAEVVANMDGADPWGSLKADRQTITDVLEKLQSVKALSDLHLLPGITRAQVRKMKSDQKIAELEKKLKEAEAKKDEPS